MEKSAKPILLIICVVLVIIAAVFFLGKGRFAPSKEETVKETPVIEQGKDSVVSEEGERETTTVIKKKIIPPVAIEETLGPEQMALKKREEVKKFFDYLDGQDYIKKYGIEEGTYWHFLKLLSKLSSHPPVVSGEMKNISTLTRNMAHFYRVMGKKDIVLFKDILFHEKRIIEPTMELLYEWISREIETESGQIEITPGGLYEYAAFFLNTIAGKAYLMRRDSKTRMLSTYYSVLIVDGADKENMNRYGVNILPVINFLLEDLSKYGGLDNSEKYNERLKSLKTNLKNRAS
jgi:hypothetical protein